MLPASNMFFFVRGGAGGKGGCIYMHVPGDMHQSTGTSSDSNPNHWRDKAAVLRVVQVRPVTF
jgi:hypothetical protein